ncbi:hypothetical protein EQG41_12415 [Billgrantia azerbaijanica]|nr:hypothetical protein EQG41_12415 [Halomonas azerbaijanica]
MLPHLPSAIVELPEPTNDSRTIITAASQALHAIYRPTYRFVKAGVMLIDLLDANRAQL